MRDTRITLDEFGILCKKGQRYEGEVEGLGYVFWKTITLSSPTSGMSGQTPYNTPKGTTFTYEIHEMMIAPRQLDLEMERYRKELVKEVRKKVVFYEEDGSVILRHVGNSDIKFSKGSRVSIKVEDNGLISIFAIDSILSNKTIFTQKTLTDILKYDAEITKKKPIQYDPEGIARLKDSLKVAHKGFGAYGAVNSIEALSKKAIYLDHEYMRKASGQIIKNKNRGVITKGKLAQNVGTKLFIIGLVADPILAYSGIQTWDEAKRNMTINTGIFVIGLFCPPAGAILGTLYFISGFIENPQGAILQGYEEMHGSPTPADKLKIEQYY